MKTRVTAVLAVTFALSSVLTAIWPQWIEGLTGYDPDAGNGTLEWAFVFMFAAAAVGAASAVRRTVRSRHVQAADGDSR